MENSRPTSGRVLWWGLMGAIAGGLFLAFDGAILGAILGSLAKPNPAPLEGAGLWAGYLGIAGAVLGFVIGAIARLAGPRMVLEPPEKKEDPV